MGIVIRLADKLIFSALLLVALQIPILADHYRQYLSGYIDASQQQVSGYQRLADDFGYPSVESMISALEQNPEALIRADAENKRATLEQLAAMQTAMQTLQQGHYYEQAWYMFNPAHAATLKRVLDNFSPSVPLTPAAIIYSVITAILLNLLIWLPYLGACGCVKLYRHHHRKKQYSQSA
ncbi:DUF2937 family protein [Alteromonas halophila]|uniref:DUF2937 family protein n=1 Tax=Alteromonas halophila TaxID=516698 RepID=A0A918JFE4_9ALTE|nr:DUF2937 family protein [Alteromonas halophila]GGW75102.1 hypothetical protein GCM10007391_04120 [Alteromonas halophila]